ncbi:MAG: phytanoyl-CoA dioxygenase family protein [Candidatus Hydrogenedentes bacterium]|nr:phytanoyl-CoA dioxygenase family protein [Candidatus Hydrogenedentota bacterium]
MIAPYRTELTQDEIAAFNERGFHVHDRIFADDEVGAIREACEAVCQAVYETGVPPDGAGWRPGGDPCAVRKIDNCWKANRTIAKYVTDTRLGHIAAQLIGAPGIRLWHDQYLYKPARGGKVVTWHQDWAYWQMIGECRTVTCWIALSDITPDCGPMVYLEGSHKFGLFPLPKGISGDDEQKPVLPDGVHLREVPIIVKKGQVAFHHGLTLHGSGINDSEADRQSLVSHVMSTECTYKPGQPHMNEVKMKEQADCPQPGERFRGPQFPMMWPANS